jgi:hypothetical protein
MNISVHDLEDGSTAQFTATKHESLCGPHRTAEPSDT